MECDQGQQVSTKQCVVCNTVLTGRQQRFCSSSCTYKDFNSRKSERKARKRDGIRCRDCGKVIVAQRLTKKYCNNKCKDNYKSKNATRWVRIEQRYGLTQEGWQALLDSQGGVCAICQKDSKVWHTDHDHSCCPSAYSCGSCVRGILCNRCNQAIGLMDDSIDNFKRAVGYLR